MGVYEIDPLRDPRWPEFLLASPRASVFHTRGWLEALRCTYGYEPVVYTTSSPASPLANGWAFCRIRSWLTGNRAVSLPFSDHCDPLVDNWEHFIEISEALRREREERGWDYIELRPIVSEPALEGFEGSETFFLHKLDLRPHGAEIFRSFHKSSTQRKIKRAEREGLVCESGVSERLLGQFYKLLVLTRRRHYLPPQPRTWFLNLVRCMGDQLSIWVASSSGIPVASILTLQLKNTLVYKYGGADQRFFNLGGMQMLFWRVIEQASRQRLSEFDLGRSDQQDHGLILFKDRLGANRSPISYFRNPPVSRRSLLRHGSTRIGKRVVSCVPARLLAAGGGLLYKHFG
jgi:hypothetical protein